MFLSFFLRGMNNSAVIIYPVDVISTILNL